MNKTYRSGLVFFDLHKIPPRTRFEMNGIGVSISSEGFTYRREKTNDLKNVDT
jgi:hypothetical protein